MKDRVHNIATETFAQLLGVELTERATDRIVMRLPYDPKLGVGRIHGGAISALDSRRCSTQNARARGFDSAR